MSLSVQPVPLSKKTTPLSLQQAAKTGLLRPEAKCEKYNASLTDRRMPPRSHNGPAAATAAAATSGKMFVLHQSHVANTTNKRPLPLATITAAAGSFPETYFHKFELKNLKLSTLASRIKTPIYNTRSKTTMSTIDQMAPATVTTTTTTTSVPNRSTTSILARDDSYSSSLLLNSERNFTQFYASEPAFASTNLIELGKSTESSQQQQQQQQFFQKPHSRNYLDKMLSSSRQQIIPTSSRTLTSLSLNSSDQNLKSLKSKLRRTTRTSLAGSSSVVLGAKAAAKGLITSPSTLSQLKSLRTLTDNVALADQHVERETLKKQRQKLKEINSSVTHDSSHEFTDLNHHLLLFDHKKRNSTQYNNKSYFLYKKATIATAAKAASSRSLSPRIKSSFSSLSLLNRQGTDEHGNPVYSSLSLPDKAKEGGDFLETYKKKIIYEHQEEKLSELNKIISETAAKSQSNEVIDKIYKAYNVAKPTDAHRGAVRKYSNNFASSKELLTKSTKSKKKKKSRRHEADSEIDINDLYSTESFKKSVDEAEVDNEANEDENNSVLNQFTSEFSVSDESAGFASSNSGGLPPRAQTNLGKISISFNGVGDPRFKAGQTKQPSAIHPIWNAFNSECMLKMPLPPPPPPSSLHSEHSDPELRTASLNREQEQTKPITHYNLRRGNSEMKNTSVTGVGILKDPSASNLNRASGAASQGAATSQTPSSEAADHAPRDKKKVSFKKQIMETVEFET